MDTTPHRIAVAALLIGSLAGSAWAQQSPPTTRETGNTLTGGAEGAHTDQATPGAPEAAGSRSQQSSGSGSGSSATGNTVTGGAEGMPTDQATPSGSSSGSGSAMGGSGAPAGAAQPQQGTDTRQK